MAVFMLCWIYGAYNAIRASTVRRLPGTPRQSLLAILANPEDPARPYAVRQLTAMAVGMVCLAAGVAILSS